MAEGQAVGPKRVDADLIKSEIAISPGGQDSYGRPVILFPVASQARLQAQFTSAHLVVILRHYMQLMPPSGQGRGYSFVANLKTYTREGLHMVVESLDQLQRENQGSVATLYVVQPKSKDLQKVLRKLVGLKHSKKSPRSPNFETILVSECSELAAYIHVSQLTSDFGGTLKYNHSHWIHLAQTMEGMEVAFNRCLDKVPGTQDKLSMMMEYEVPENQQDVHSLLQQIRAKYHDVMRDINVEHTIDEMKLYIEKMNAPHQHPEYSEITNSPLFTDAKQKFQLYERELVKHREHLKSLWQEAETRVLLMSRIKKYMAKADKVLKWIDDVGLPTVKQDAEIADCLSKAEVLKNHFETGFYSIAENVIWLSEKIQKKMDGIILENTGTGMEDFTTYAKQFKGSIEYFRQSIDQKHQVYVNVYNFFLSSNKIAKWYRRTLQYLPIQLLNQNISVVNGHQVMTLQATEAWTVAMDAYLLQNPLPRSRTHVQKLKNVIPVIDNISVRNQARLLVHRVEIMCKLIRSPEHVPFHELQEILRWKEQVSLGQDDITLNLTSSTLDLTRPDQFEPGLGKNGQLVSNGRVPKLKVSKINVSDANNDRLSSTLGRRPKSSHVIGHSENSHIPRPHSAHFENGVPHHLATGYTSNSYNENPIVPKLDLSYMQDDSINVENAKGIKRQNSYGIYGESDYIPTTNDAVSGQNANQVLPNHSRGDSNERYVSLNYENSPRSDEHGIIENDVEVQQKQTDQSQHEKPGQHNSISQSHASNIGHESQKDMPLQNAKSLPDLSSTKANELTLMPENLDMVMNSALTAGEKLDVMAAMCETAEGSVALNLSPSLKHRLYQNGDVRPKSKSAQPILHSMPSRDTNNESGNVARRNKTNDPGMIKRSKIPISQTKRRSLDDSSESERSDLVKNTSVVGSTAEKNRRESPAKSSKSRQIPVYKGHAGSPSKTPESVSRAKKAHEDFRGRIENYGIDIEEWMSKHEPHSPPQREDSSEMEESQREIGSLSDEPQREHDSMMEEPKLQRENKMEAPKKKKVPTATLR